MHAPIRFRGPGIFRAYDNYLGLPFDKILRVMASLRHMLLAEWTGKTAVKHEKNVRFATKISHSNQLAFEIR
jgi:hypothetical protein